MTLEEEIKKSFKRMVYVSVLTVLIATGIMILIAPTEQGKAQALMMLFSVIVFGIITAVMSSFYFLLKSKKTLSTTWKWKFCILAPLLIPIGTIPEVIKLMPEPFFLSANIITLCWGLAVLVVATLNYKSLNRGVQLMLT